eukprot:63137-Chlamydomonas_euryale.AAC.2
MQRCADAIDGRNQLNQSIRTKVPTQYRAPAQHAHGHKFEEFESKYSKGRTRPCSIRQSWAMLHAATPNERASAAALRGRQ